MSRTPAHIREVIRQLYTYREWGCQRIAAYLKARGTPYCVSTIWLCIRELGLPPRPVGAHYEKCIECGKPTENTKRCDFHRRLREAERQREYWEERKGAQG